MSPRPRNKLTSIFSTSTLLLGSFLLVPSPLFAQTSAAESPGVSSAAMLQMLLGLALIITILFAGAYVLRRLNGGQNFGHNGGALKIVGGLMISPRERILLVELGDTWLVVGVVPGQIKTLHTLPKGELPEDDRNAKPFGQWLKQMTERNHAQK